MRIPKQLSALTGLALVLGALIVPAGAQASFGLQSVSVAATNLDKSIDFQAGSHPDLTVNLAMNLTLNQDSEEIPDGTLRNLLVELPPGLLGNPQAIPRCATADFEGTAPGCPIETQIGVARVKINGFTDGPVLVPVYNLTPPLGVAAKLGFSLFGFNSFQEASLRSDGDYGVDVADITVPKLEIQAVSETIWGVPADPAHDAERSEEAINGGLPHTSPAPLAPFLTLPSACGQELKTTVRVESLQEPGVFQSKSTLGLADGEAPTSLEGCNAIEFAPTITAQPTTNLADSPSGLDVNLHVPQAPLPEARAGATVLCIPGSWSEAPSSYAYQWLRNGVAIPGATDNSYEVRAEDQGATLQCEVAADNSAAGPGHAASTPVLLAPNPTPAAPVPARPIVNSKRQGQDTLLTCDPGSWSGNPSFTYQWYRDGSLDATQTESTYAVPSGEEPLTLQCEVSGENASGAAVAFSANARTAPPPGPALPDQVSAPKAYLPAADLPLATAALKDAVVTLPAGMTLNPSAANGLGACSEAEIGYLGGLRFSENPQSCPNASKVGTLEVNSPLVDHKLAGAIYVARPYQNPFGSLLAIYLAVEDPQTGVIAKLAGKVSPDPGTGQLTATFKDNPQLPIEDIETHFFGGPGAALKTPLTCGTKTTTTTLVPWSTPEGADANPSDSFQTSVAPSGGPCPSSEAGAPNKPAFTAGTHAPEAGAYSPFLLKLTRNDGSQRLTGIDATLPKGLTGKLAGVPYCSEAQIAVAKAREAPNQGAVEQSNPSCPLASEVGSVTVGAGAGITPLYVTGHAYLAGPYKGAPISLVIITPAVAGPFDLGAVVARTALYVNSETAQIHAVSDPLPSIIQGIPLNLRSIALKMDRPDFTLNPTSCDPTAITGAATALTGQSAALTSPFQVGGCSALKFKPKLAISLKGGTKRNKYPALRAVVTYPKKGRYANIASAQVTLPHSAFLEQAHIGTVCTRVQFAADACPKASIYGFARAFTPLLDKPVEGPVYLRSSSHELPDLVAALRGQVNVDLVGRVDTGKGGGIRNTFEATPDAPVSKFVLEMKGGRKGLLVNSENICKKPQRALVSYRAHNGDAYEAQPLIGNDCGKKAKKKGKGKSKAQPDRKAQR